MTTVTKVLIIAGVIVFGLIAAFVKQWWDGLGESESKSSSKQEPRSHPHPHPPASGEPSGDVIDPHSVDGALKTAHFQPDGHHWRRGKIFVHVDIGMSELRVGVWLHSDAHVEPDERLRERGLPPYREAKLTLKAGHTPVRFDFWIAPGDGATLLDGVKFLEELVRESRLSA